MPPGGKLRHFQREPTGSCHLCRDPFLPFFAWGKKEKKVFLLAPGQESARSHRDTGAGGGRAGPRHGPRAWCGSRRSQRRGKKDPPSDGLFNTRLPGCLRRVRRLCRGKSPLEKAPLLRQHPCGVFWTVGAGNTIHRGRGIVVPEISWAARLGIHRGGRRLQPGTSELCAASPARSPAEMRCCRCQQLSPSVPIQLRREPSHRGDLMAGEAGPGRSEPAARHGTARQPGTAQLAATGARLRPCGLFPRRGSGKVFQPCLVFAKG